MTASTIINFGKHKGMDIRAVEDSYLDWMVDTFSKKEGWKRWKSAAKGERRRRRRIKEDMIKQGVAIPVTGPPRPKRIRETPEEKLIRREAEAIKAAAELEASAKKAMSEAEIDELCPF